MTDQMPPLLSNSVIVAAHPDDELLWFGAILQQVERVILVFEDYWPDPAMGPARAEALANYPRDGIMSLQMSEPATYGCADWQQPKLSPWGIALGPTCEFRDAKHRAKRLIGKSMAPQMGIRAHYQANYEELVQSLRGEMDPTMNVFTHNPWGEYGHEDHVQLYRALDALRAEIGFTLWMSNYCTDRSLPLAKTYFDTSDHQFFELPVDRHFADKVTRTYRDAGCWTWADDWHWFKTECYMQAPLNQSRLNTQGHLFPINLFNIDPT